MEVIKFVALLIGSSLISTAVLALIARPLVSAVRYLVYPRQEAARTITVPEVR
jgi:hypothetical protein